MRVVCFVILLGATAGAQSLVEYSGAAAGGAVGGVAGKKVSDGVTSIFNKLDKAAGKAAGTEKHGDKGKAASGPLMEVGPGVPHTHAAAPAPAAAAPARAEAGSVPPPPPVRGVARRRPSRAPLPAPAAEPVMAAPPPPPPPMATSADLRTIVIGARRVDVLALGAPAARITMFDDGHLIEIYRYMSRDGDIGVVRLYNGTVSSIQVN